MNRPPPTLKWGFDGLQLLRLEGAPRVFRPQGLADWLVQQGRTPSRRHLFNTLLDWEATGFVAKVAHGVYLNRLIKPDVDPEEAVPHLRQGAVVGLQRVMGKAGVLNNPSDWITAVAPAGPPALRGDPPPGAPHYLFARLHPDLLPSPGTAEAEGCFDPMARVPTATPEKALVDWLYLSQITNGREWPAPPLDDMDLDLLDLDLLRTLADRFQVRPTLDAWLGKPQATPERRRPRP